MLINSTSRESLGNNQSELWEIEGLNDEDIAAELLDQRVEFSTVVPLWDCGCNEDCRRFNFPGS
ncbi:hypothetical protein EPA93_17475 [Ktedonosporobacter rubrisoli]|uniref:Uncharacterized protein n=1 Tax=Ktedonosporobacter rubrisoli TaxID=2509675 RepID=A0A4P6JQY5_KTERU|nr:hypothetical protein [Ktedonosporobacter rubrisoli]QBD77683.1 hypothetical protein EPA93_17475 [Ktedonosporobacter rubrisoli]